MKHIALWFTGVYILFLAITLAASEASQPPTKIHAMHLKYRLNKEGTKDYNKFLDAIKKKGVQYSTSFNSINRTHLNFTKDKNSCIFPTTLKAEMANNPAIDSDSLITGETVDYVSAGFFTRQTQKTIKSLSELNNKHIAIPLGWNIDIWFKGINAKIETTEDEETRIRLLNLGRVDAIFGIMPDVILAANSLHQPEPKFEKSIALIQDGEISIICHNTPNNNTFISHFNKALNELKQSGELKRTLNPYAHIAP